MTPAAYDIADRLLQLAPWGWMNESMLIAIEEPESGRRDHISIMGMAGTHRALALYLGPVARQRFNLIQEERDFPQEDLMTLILDTPQIQCAFDRREGLYQSELAAIKRSGRRFRGDGWPNLRLFRPGRCPAPTEEKDTQWLCTAIEQVLEVAPTLKFGDDTVRFSNGRLEILTRLFLNGEWRTAWTPDDNSLFAFPQPAPDAFMLEKVSRHSKTVEVEAAFMITPNPVGKSRDNSVFPYLLLMVEPESQMVLGAELFSVETAPHEELIRSVPTGFLSLCDRHNIRPASVAVVSPATHALLAPTAAALGVRCDLFERLPALENALHSLMDFMRKPQSR